MFFAKRGLTNKSPCVILIIEREEMQMEEYRCPKCGSENIYVFDDKDCEINLEDETFYVRSAMSCESCGHDFTMIVEGGLTDIKIERR